MLRSGVVMKEGEKNWKLNETPRNPEKKKPKIEFDHIRLDPRNSGSCAVFLYFL